jgi:multisubunit Na+/H+ antiporter MnhB subunit
MIESAIDLLLAAAILAVAASALHSRDLFRGVVLFIVFGFLMAIAWVRLEAPDIALAEAAIGAGITGALLLDAVGQIGRRKGSTVVPLRFRVAAPVLVVPVALLLAIAVWSLPRTAGGLTAAAEARIAESGVSHPVTAVLLNFRSYDTWLEVVVLLTALVGVLALARRDSLSGDVAPSPRDPMLAGGATLLVPAMILIGGYLLWRGTHAPGGAFQAGAVIGSAGVLLILAGYDPFRRLRGEAFRTMTTLGLLGFLGAATVSAFQGHRFLALDSRHAGSIIVAVELAVAVSVALTLTALFVAARGAGSPHPELEQGEHEVLAASREPGSSSKETTGSEESE